MGLSLGAQAKTAKVDANVSNTTLLNPDCPLTLAGISMDRASSRGNRVSVLFENESDKRVIGIKVGFDGLDAVKDLHPLAKPFSLAVDLLPNRTDGPVWALNDPDFAANTAGGIRVYVIKIMFQNGATWQDDGSQACSLTISGRARAPKHAYDDGD
jgi:hypothetical protein